MIVWCSGRDCAYHNKGLWSQNLLVWDSHVCEITPVVIGVGNLGPRHSCMSHAHFNYQSLAWLAAEEFLPNLVIQAILQSSLVQVKVTKDGRDVVEAHSCTDKSMMLLNSVIEQIRMFLSKSQMLMKLNCKRFDLKVFVNCLRDGQ